MLENQKTAVMPKIESWLKEKIEKSPRIARFKRSLIARDLAEIRRADQMTAKYLEGKGRFVAWEQSQVELGISESQKRIKKMTGKEISLNEEINWAILHNLGWPVKILNLGAFTGVLAKEIKEKYGKMVEVHAVSAAYLPQWKRDETGKQIKWHVAGNHQLSKKFAGEKFDVVIGVDCFHESESAEINKQLKEITKPNARIIVSPYR